MKKKYRYILFYKPYNVLCQFTDKSEQAQQRQTLKDYIKIPCVYSVGRLDLEQGVIIKGKKTKKAQAKLLEKEPHIPPRNPPIRDRKNIPTAWIELILTEGRNRQVRRMTAAVGYPTLRLIRVKIGINSQLELNLEGLSPGEWRYLTEEEKKQVESLVA